MVTSPRPSQYNQLKLQMLDFFHKQIQAKV